MSKLELAHVFSDHMVLQQQSEVSVWGHGAAPGRQVVVFGSWGSTAVTKADGKGNFNVKIKTGNAGGPYLLRVRSKETVEVTDVLLGEVWVCSGQSNMEMPVGPLWNPSITDSVQETRSADHPNLRLFHVPNRRSLTPQADVDASWAVCTPESVRGFSATAYFFGRDLQAALGVPVGLIETCVGGTEAELWTSEDKLKTLPDFDASLSRMAKSQEEYQTQVRKINQENVRMDPGYGKWEAPGYDDSSWESTRAAAWSETGLADFDGVAWYRVTVDVPSAGAGKAATLTLGPIDDYDMTYVGGKQVGMTIRYDTPRKYNIPAGLLRAGANVVAVRVHDTGGEGGFTDPSKIALQGDGWSADFGTWKRKVSTPQAKMKPVPNPPGGNSQLYNGMVAPLIPYGVRGAIWYQGESNVGRGYQYRTLFPAMIQDWRARWGVGTFPFYFVQIAPWSGYGGAASAVLRESQLLTLSTLKNTGMVVTTDIAPDLSNIHPPDKQDVGKRLSLLALHDTYGRSGFLPSGPLYQSASFAGGKATVSFKYAIGMHGTLEGFEVAGSDKVWHPAHAAVEGDKVVVSSPDVKKPVAVRYGWSDVPKGTLFNGAGLPASPFRSDRWERITQNTKW